ncbi:hypothetical protein PINS_up007309 [Pythium insidiosum]|nr:hypothetical protein PINS_up007309 [Pythium insidiosum]
MADMMTPEAIRELGDGLSRARELCQEAQYDKGMQLYESTLARLRQFVRKMSKMSERQPWLQVFGASYTIVSVLLISS